MKPIFLTSIIFLYLAAGCAAAPKPNPAAIKAEDPAKAALTDKLAKMTPEERAAYVQSHQDEINKSFSGIKVHTSSSR